MDPGRRPLLRRLLGGAARQQGLDATVVDFAQIEPFVSHVPTARLRIPYRRLSKLHPAQIADLVEAASHEEGEEIIEAVGLDRELEADVFEELDTEHQLEFIDQRTDDDAARLLSRMAPDDAADLISEVDQERRLPLLELMAEPQQRKVRNLLSYPAESAGGLMSPDYAAIGVRRPRSSAALDAVARRTAPIEALNVVFVLDEDGATRRHRHRSPPSSAPGRPQGRRRHARRPRRTSTRTGTCTASRAQMSDFNLTVVPVLDEDHGRRARRRHRGRPARAAAAAGLAARVRHDGGRGVTTARRRRPPAESCAWRRGGRCNPQVDRAAVGGSHRCRRAAHDGRERRSSSS